MRGPGWRRAGWRRDGWCNDWGRDDWWRDRRCPRTAGARRSGCRGRHRPAQGGFETVRHIGEVLLFRGLRWLRRCRCRWCRRLDVCRSGFRREGRGGVGLRGSDRTRVDLIRLWVDRRRDCRSFNSRHMRRHMHWRCSGARRGGRFRRQGMTDDRSGGSRGRWRRGNRPGRWRRVPELLLRLLHRLLRGRLMRRRGWMRKGDRRRGGLVLGRGRVERNRMRLGLLLWG